MKQIPDAITKRDILHGSKKMTSQEKASLGDLFQKEGWTSDAIDFYVEAPDRLQQLTRQLVDEGNVFLLLKVFRVLNKENQDEILKASENAEAQGKFRYAIKGYEKLENIEKAEEIKKRLSEDGDMKSALNSVFIPKTEEQREEELEEEA